MATFFLLLTLLLSVGTLHASDLYTPDEIKKEALEIDKLVAANFNKNGIKVPAVTDDATFMRRAFLVSNGRIPTPKEALQFLELNAPNKRDLLIDYLYNSEGYTVHDNN